MVSNKSSIVKKNLKLSRVSSARGTLHTNDDLRRNIAPPGNFKTNFSGVNSSSNIIKASLKKGT